MMKCTVRTLFAMVASLLGACTVVSKQVDDSLPIAGGVATLHADVQIKPGYARVIIQAGRVVATASDFRPSCRLQVSEIAEPASAPQYIKAGDFKITGRSRRVNDIVSDSGIIVAALFDDWEDYSRRFATVRYTLSSVTQPSVMALICGKIIDGNEWRISRSHLREALGDLLTIAEP